MLKILVVDDDKSIRDSFYDFFVEMKYEVFRAETGISALKIVKAQSPEIIIVDYDLPDLNGVELIGQIKKIDKSAKFIIISGKIDNAGIKSGVDELISKLMDLSGKGVSDKRLKEEIDNLGIIEFVPKPVSLSYIKNSTFPKIQEYQFLIERKMHQKILDMELQTLKIAINALESKDKYTEGHSKRVMKYSLELVNFLPERLKNKINFKILGHAALLHDIGKIGISEWLLNKTGKLKDDEFAVIRRHPLESIKILEPLSTDMPLCISAIKHHHERFDGTGYPDRLKGENIPLFARIISVSDAYDAMTSDRAYRPRFAYNIALAEIIKNKNIQFDPFIADAFITSIENQ